MIKKYKAPAGLDYSYLIYPPSGAHKGFRMIKMFKRSGRTESIRLPELEQINQNFLGNKINKIKARELIEQIREDLYKKDGVKVVALVFNSDNRKVLESYWEDEYVPRLSKLEDAKTARNELDRAIQAIGPISLRVGTKQAIQKQVDKVAKGNKQRRIVSKLNSVLKYLKRDIVLVQAKKEQREIHYITLEDLPKLLAHLPDEDMKLLHAVCFYTGVRLGEAMALDARTYNPGSDTIRVLSQIDKEGKKRETKNDKTRTTVVIPEGREVLQDWFHVRSKFSHSLRLRISRYTRKAAAAAFPDKSLKHITFHDLRHSYAIHLLSKGVPISLVAQCLGDSIAVAEEYYVGYDLSEGAIDLISRTLKSS